MRTRRIIAFLLSLGTLVGGHIYNGRWARATLFAAMLLCTLAVAGLVGLYGLLRFSARDYVDYYDALEAIRQFKTFAAIVTAAVAALWLASAITAASEVAPTTDGPVAESRRSQRLAVVAMCAFGVLALAAIPWVWHLYKTHARPFEKPSARIYRPPRAAVRAMSKGPTVVTEAPPLPAPRPEPFSPFSGFHGSTWGGAAAFLQSVETLEAGAGTIRGQVVGDGEPLAGLKLSLYFDDRRKTVETVSDAEGYYSIAVPPGEYELAGWELDPATAHSVLSGMIDMPGKSGPFGQFHVMHLDVEADAVTTGPRLEFTSAIQPVAPTGEAEVTTDTVFHWEPHPLASWYELKLDVYGIFFTSMARRLRPTHSPRVEGTTTTAAQAGYTLYPGRRYSWSVEAFDSSGERVSTIPRILQPVFRVRMDIPATQPRDAVTTR